MEWLATVPRQLIGGLLPLYREESFGYSVAGGMALAAIVLVVLAFIRHAFQMLAISQRLRILSGRVTFQSGREADRRGDAHQAALSDNFDAIDEKMSSPFPFSGGLETAWEQFRRYLVRQPDQPVAAGMQPAAAYARVQRIGSELDFFSGVFIAFGLLATFLGLVAALSFAAEGMQSGDALAMQVAVRDLIAASASKFVTSIAGVGLSILLRLADRTMDSRFSQAMRQLMTALERSVQFAPAGAARA